MIDPTTRALLERCYTKWMEDADPAECGELVNAIRAELAKPIAPVEPVNKATVIPEGIALYLHPPTPAWHDTPTCAGWWVCLYQGNLSTAIFNDYGVENFDAEQMAECRWYGPIPQDKEGGAA